MSYTTTMNKFIEMIELPETERNFLSLDVTDEIPDRLDIIDKSMIECRYYGGISGERGIELIKEVLRLRELLDKGDKS